MTDYPYRAPCSYFLVYVYEIPGSVDYAGLSRTGTRPPSRLRRRPNRGMAGW